MDEQRLYDILGQDMEVPDMVDKKLKETYAQMEENQRPAKRRSPRALGMALVAAALAAGCVLCVAAGLPAQVYHFIAGGSTAIEADGGEAHITIDNEAASPVTVENGRLMFEADGQKLDVTDKVDADTPYIYERTDPKTGNKGYVILGGTVDDYGWAEFFLTEDGACSMAGENAWDYMVPIDGRDIPFGELTEAQMDLLNGDGGALMKTVNRPWLDEGIAQLGLEVALGIVD